MSVWSKIARGAADFGAGVAQGAPGLTAVITQKANQRREDERRAEDDKRQDTRDIAGSVRDSGVFPEESYNTIAQENLPLANQLKAEIGVADNARAGAVDEKAQQVIGRVRAGLNTLPWEHTPESFAKMEQDYGQLEAFDTEASRLNPSHKSGSYTTFAFADYLDQQKDGSLKRLTFDERLHQMRVSRRNVNRNSAVAKTLGQSDSLDDHLLGIKLNVDSGRITHEHGEMLSNSARKSDRIKTYRFALNRLDGETALKIATELNNPTLIDMAQIVKNQDDESTESRMFMGLFNGGHYTAAYNVSEGSNNPDIQRMGALAVQQDTSLFNSLERDFYPRLRDEIDRIKDDWRKESGYSANALAINGAGALMPSAAEFESQALQTMKKAGDIGYQRHIIKREAGLGLGVPLTNIVINNFLDRMKLVADFPEMIQEDVIQFHAQIASSQIMSLAEKQEVASYINETFPNVVPYDLEVIPGGAYESPVSIAKSPFQIQFFNSSIAEGATLVREAGPDGRDSVLALIESSLEAEALKGGGIGSLIHINQIGKLMNLIEKASVRSSARDRINTPVTQDVATTDVLPTADGTGKPKSSSSRQRKEVPVGTTTPLKRIVEGAGFDKIGTGPPSTRGSGAVSKTAASSAATAATIPTDQTGSNMSDQMRNRINRSNTTRGVSK
tara:strand:- start:2202 stop:4220 length:2019 start_codon:yes stop_codon:yes gene_type:complete